MDLWVVAAAAGAGYAAKNLQNLSLDKKESLDKYSFSFQSESRNILQKIRDKTCPLRKLARKGARDYAFLDSDNDFSDIDRLKNRDLESGVASISGNALEKDRLDEGYYNTNRVSNPVSVFSAEEFEDGESRNFSRVSKGRIVKSRRPYSDSIRPLSSLGSCIENVEESNTYLLSPSMSRVRRALVRDGNRIISKSRSCSSFTQFEGCRDETRGSLDRSQGSNGVLLFITGMTIGIMSATTAWKNEVDKLDKQLKQMDNLVQDLHEELDMKESLMVKELIDSPPSVQEPISSPSDVKIKKLAKIDSPVANAENPELMSKIEAELQAELEMLELNMKASARERINNVVELDQDFEPDIVQGDLKSNIADKKFGDSSESRTMDFSQPVNYAVCPWELSTRLHELIESRLETRIKELETALSTNRQNGVRILDSQSAVSSRRFSYSETESSSTHQSPLIWICDEHEKREHGPSKKENPDEPNGISHDSVIIEEDGSMDFVQDLLESWDKQISTGFTSNGDYGSEEDEGVADESEMLLIKQILERRKSGSNFKNLEI